MSEVFSWREAPPAQFAVIGDPVSHSLSPKMHRAAYRVLELDYEYHAIRVIPGEVAPALEHLRSIGYQGINVTVPLKEEALAWAEKADPFAQRVRAANTLRLANRECINTDAPGFLDTLAPYSFPERTALVLGAGGSARAISVALLQEGFQVFLYNRTHAKAIALGVEIGINAGDVRQNADPAGASIIVNTTSASLANDEVPLLWDHAQTNALAYDLMYARESTPFLRVAATHGLQTLDGRRMLVAQGARSFEWWLGIPAPRQVMLEAIQ